MDIIFNAIGHVFAVGLAVIIADVLVLAMLRSKVLPRNLITSWSLILLIGLGFIGLWEIHHSALKIAVMFLYLTGAIVYLECRSLLSRGYSMRLLLDLFQAGGTMEADRLQSAYGQGLGLDGLLRKRLRTMEGLHLIKIQGDQIGPLTGWGILFAIPAHYWRKLLRLENVG